MLLFFSRFNMKHRSNMGKIIRFINTRIEMLWHLEIYQVSNINTALKWKALQNCLQFFFTNLRYKQATRYSSISSSFFIQDVSIFQQWVMKFLLIKNISVNIKEESNNARENTRGKPVGSWSDFDEIEWEELEVVFNGIKVTVLMVCYY